jgi:8-oxo-dGTP pyrophosphatase MutT (NUDIX family)
MFVAALARFSTELTDGRMTNLESLRPAQAVAALMVLPNGDYLLQHRDDHAEIFFPGFWGNLGGAIDDGETAEQALAREIFEELRFEVKATNFFCTLTMDFGFCGLGNIPRHFYEIFIEHDDVTRMRQLEGQGMAPFSATTILAMSKVAPYDALVIWQHAWRGRFRG